MTLKQRAASGPTATGYVNGVVSGQTILTGFTESQETFNHSGFPKDLGGPRDVGGPWLLKRDEYHYNLGKILNQRFVGSDTVISGGPGDQTHPSPPSDASLYPKGANAISLCIPTNPIEPGYTFLSETLSDGLPSLFGVQTWKHRTQAAHNAGGEYLNVQFGWLPLISDMRGFAKAVKEHHSALQQLRNGSGHVTRVGMQFPPSETSSSGPTNMLLYQGGNTGVSTAASGSYYRSQTSKTWFSGAFEYHLPIGKGQLQKAQLYAEYADKLLGIKPTPTAIFNASPWSWALDWFSNAGAIVNNIGSLHQNGLVLKYGYLMTSTESVDSLGTSGHTTATGVQWGPAYRTRKRVFKKRIPASPYGFGVSDGDLSPQQKAIIAALGLTFGHGGHG